MKKYEFYCEYFKTREIKEIELLVSKTKKSYLIGPKITKKFDAISFYKRIASNSVYDLNIYKKCYRKKMEGLINKYYHLLNDNEVVEIFKNGEIIIHSIISIPGGMYEKKQIDIR